MPKMFVDVPALNFRSAPVVDPSNKLGTLFLGQSAEILAPARCGCRPPI